MPRNAALSVVFAIIAAATVLVSATPAGACSCAGLDDDAGFAEADAVFLGAVEQIYDARSGSSANPEVVVFQVSDVFKGTVTQSQGVVTAADSASCGYDFVAGGVYVVFGDTGAALDDGTAFYETELCSGTRLLDDTTPDFGVAPQPPLEGAPSVAQIQEQLGSPRDSLFPELFILAGVLAFVLGLAAWFSRKNRPAI